MVKSLAKRLGPENITVNAIAPGFFESEMTVITSEEMRQMVVSMVPRRRVGEAADMAGVAIYLASRAGAYVTGSVIARKSVVWGKHVSVRVALGGRRIINKKNDIITNKSTQ